MKKSYLPLIFIISISMLLSSCKRDRDAYLIMEEFLLAYGAEGTVYSSRVSEGDEGFVADDFISGVYGFVGESPENYAIFFNAHPVNRYECGVFVCYGADEIMLVEEMCLGRIRLLSATDRGFVGVKNGVVFYSTMKETERARKIWNNIIK